VTVMLTWSVLMTSYKPHRLVRVVFDSLCHLCHQGDGER